MARYRYNCVDTNDENELAYIVRNMTPIQLPEFESHVDENDFRKLQKQLGYSEHVTISRDWHVKFAKCELPDTHTTAYVLIHSAIEHVFY